MKESKIDSTRFGFKVGKIFKDTSLDVIKNNDYKMVIARVDFNDVELINRLEEIGFRIKDTQITYKHNLQNLKVYDSFEVDPLITLRDFKESDTNYLVDIAKSSFNNYGHYFNNKNLDRKKCLEVYEDWAYNTCTKKEVADKIIVACKDNKPVGYLSFKIYEDSLGKRYAVGGMGAVDSKLRGANIFPRILKKGLDWSYDSNLDWCEHNVLVNNFSVNKSMIKTGFMPNKHIITMHLMIT